MIKAFQNGREIFSTEGADQDTINDITRYNGWSEITITWSCNGYVHETVVQGFGLAWIAEKVTESDNPSDTLAELASAKMVEMNLTYGQAAEYVLKTNPSLAHAYREYTMNPNKGE